MYPPSLISQSNSDCSVLTEAEVVAIVMVVRSDPTHPHTGGVLTRENPHRVVVLRNRTQAGYLQHLMLLTPKLQRCFYIPS